MAAPSASWAGRSGQFWLWFGLLVVTGVAAIVSIAIWATSDDGDGEFAVVATAPSVAPTPTSEPDPTPSPPTPTPTPDEAAPYTDFATISDQTGAFTVDVPAAWSDIADEPSVGTQGQLLPTIVASTSVDGFMYAWSDPGVGVELHPRSDFGTPADVIADAAAFFETECAPSPTSDYRDSGPGMPLEQWEDCGAEAAEVLFLVATPPDETWLAVIQVTALDDRDIDAADRIFASLNIDTSRLPEWDSADAPPPPAPAPPPPAAPDPPPPSTGPQLTDTFYATPEEAVADFLLANGFPIDAQCGPEGIPGTYCWELREELSYDLVVYVAVPQFMEADAMWVLVGSGSSGWAVADFAIGGPDHPF